MGLFGPKNGDRNESPIQTFLRTGFAYKIDATDEADRRAREQHEERMFEKLLVALGGAPALGAPAPADPRPSADDANAVLAGVAPDADPRNDPRFRELHADVARQVRGAVMPPGLSLRTARALSARGEREADRRAEADALEHQAQAA